MISLSKPTWFKGIKTAIFLGLLTVVIVVYAVEILSKYENDATTFATKTKEIENFMLPPLTICMQNGLKPSVLKKHGVYTNYGFVYGMDNNNIASVWDTYVEASYLLNRDFEIYLIYSRDIDTYNASSYLITLALDKNYGEHEGNRFEIIVHEYHTPFLGTCYQINSNLSIQPPDMLYMQFSINESLNRIDFPQVSLKMFNKLDLWLNLFGLFSLRYLE